MGCSSLFGYIKPYRPELKIREAEEYRSIYCGLCKELGKSYGIFAKMTLSYDFAFMAMLFMSIEDEICPRFEKCTCMAHPFKKQCLCEQNRATSLAAKAAMILIYYKLLDNIKDKGFFNKIKALCLMPFAASARKKALAMGKEAVIIDNAAAEMIAAQQKLESECCSIADMAAQPTALFLQRVITLINKEDCQRVLERFGYLLGRYIYLCDAMDDLEDDRKKGNYNPFIYAQENALAEAKAAVFLTTAELSEDLALLPLDRYKEIVENIVYMGLRAEAQRIIEKGVNQNGSL